MCVFSGTKAAAGGVGVRLQEAANRFDGDTTVSAVLFASIGEGCIVIRFGREQHLARSYTDTPERG
ncbi:hypothetical protein C474_09107 [Halogeometricum pallidum JCM 14848]|uniref:Uncharacterized protein n=1 Tax=Halogeometricum pallidum JCM 14848 TaxID=1227487 RepID=M0D9Q5_HALPD|nr:hypothetical protein C474_09107 [Halogeometricum pallidum JCM 14848]